MRAPAFFACLCLCGAALAQTSTSYKVTEFVLNEGGHPSPVLGSTSYRVTLDSIGEGLVQTGMHSTSYAMDAGFVPPYRSPSEVVNVLFQKDRKTIVWTADKSAGDYNVYRDAFSLLPGTWGHCWASLLQTATAVDTTVPPPNPKPRGFFYLVTAENLLDEEGTKGYTSAGAERPNAIPCP